MKSTTVEQPHGSKKTGPVNIPVNRRRFPFSWEEKWKRTGIKAIKGNKANE